MAMDQSALVELLEVLNASGVDEREWITAQNLYQGLVQAEAQGMFQAGFWERTENRTSGSPSRNSAGSGLTSSRISARSRICH